MKKIHASNLFYIGICVIGMLAFAMVGIFPNMSASRELDEEVAELNQKVRAQELLFPIYVELIKQYQQKAPEGLPLPPDGKIGRSKISELSSQFMAVARRSDVNFESAIPDPISYQEETGQVVMNVSFSGDFFNFRKLLMNICQITFLRSIERMEVEVQGNDKRIHLKLLLDQE